MQPWGEPKWAHEDKLWDIREGFEAKMGRNTLFHTLHMGCGLCRGLGGHMSFGQQTWTLLPMLDFLSMVTSVPTTRCWAVLWRWA